MSDRLEDMLDWAKAAHHSTERTLNQYKQGAAIRNFTFEISDQEADILFRSRCGYCRYQPENRFNGIDRIDNKLGYVSGNVVACCLWCNRAKGRNSVSVFLKWLEWVQSGAAAELSKDELRVSIPIPTVSAIEWEPHPLPIENAEIRVTTPLYEPVDLHGLSPQEYVRRRIWGGHIELTVEAPTPKAVPIPPKPQPVAIPLPPKPKSLRLKRDPRTRVLRAHDFNGAIRITKAFRRGGSGNPS